jgi:alkanesulfonate monooxygenase SsuD/methylene tetrahydromethanopterin reductase-like flavin-dependent oxidoreductase (luciferase family)/predicted kinase
VVLVGASGSGKSAWAATRYRSQEIVSSDDLRSVVGSGPHDLDASDDAFSLLDQIVDGRLRRRLTTVVDTLGLDPERRREYVDRARRSGVASIVVHLDTAAAVCRERNASRDRPVPASVLASQLRKARDLPAQLTVEGWDRIVRVIPETPSTMDTASAPRPVQPYGAAAKPRLGVVLQVSRFPWGEDPTGWLRDVALAADEAGFEGLALMDHLIQIPQIDRSWEPIPEPFVTLGMLAGLGTRLRLGTLVTPVTMRPAGIIAKAVATLDVLSGGRAFCGIGAGWWEREHAAFGLPFPSVRERLDRLEAAVETLRALWSKGTKPYDGERVRLPETTCYPRPLNSPAIVVGGGGERRTLRIAARLGDACNLRTDVALEHKIAVFRRHCEDVGRNPDEVAVTVLDLPVVGRDRDDAWAKVERLRGRTSAATYAAKHHAGTVDDQVRRYSALAEQGVSTAFVALQHLTGPDDVLALSRLTAAVS